jgi:hypothetical protein
MARGIDKELQAIFKTDKKSKILSSFKTEVSICTNRNQLVNVLNTYMLYIYHKAELTTIRNRFTDFRKILESAQQAKSSKHNLYQYGLDFFRAPDVLIDYLNESYKDVVNERNDNRLSLPEVNFSSYKSLYEALVNDLKSFGVTTNERIYLLSILVMITTGRRFIETLKVSTFVASEKKNELLIKGIAKQKEKAVKDIHVPLLFADQKTILSWVKELRKLFPQAEAMSVSAINHKYNFTFNKSLRWFLSTWAKGNLKTDIKTLHDLRAIYAESCHKIYNIHDGEEIQTKPRYFASILGHNENDEETQKSYIKFVLKGE